MYLSKRLKNFDLSKFCVENIGHYLKKNIYCACMYKNDIKLDI